jgi:hypothetical protein
MVDGRVVGRPRDGHRFLNLNFGLIGGILVQLETGWGP